MTRKVEIGDFVRYKLSPSGVEGMCVLTEEGHAESTGERMLFGHSKRKDEFAAVSLYESDIIEILKVSQAECWSCGREWEAVRPEETIVLECPSCGEQMGAGR